jgi:hypothetical protein
MKRIATKRLFEHMAAEIFPDLMERIESSNP